MLNALVRNNNEPQRSKRAPLVLFIVALFQIAFQNHSFFLFHFSLMLISSFTTFPFRNLTFLRTVEDRQLLNEIQRAADGPSTTTTNNDRNKLAGSSLVAQREPPQQQLVTSPHKKIKAEPVGPDFLILGSRCGPRPRCQWLDQSSRPRGTRPPVARHHSTHSTHSTTEPCLSSILHPALPPLAAPRPSSRPARCPAATSN